MKNIFYRPLFALTLIVAMFTIGFAFGIPANADNQDNTINATDTASTVSTSAAVPASNIGIETDELYRVAYPNSYKRNTPNLDDRNYDLNHRPTYSKRSNGNSRNYRSDRDNPPNHSAKR